MSCKKCEDRELKKQQYSLRYGDGYRTFMCNKLGCCRFKKKGGYQHRGYVPITDDKYTHIPPKEYETQSWAIRYQRSNSIRGPVYDARIDTLSTQLNINKKEATCLKYMG